MAALWLLAHQTVKHRFAELKSTLPSAYQFAVAAPPDEDSTPRLIPLCVDLMRKAPCTDPFDALSAQEQRMALHASAVETLPTWMSKYAGLALSRPHKAIIVQLRQIKASRPNKPKQYFGHVKRQQQLRSTPET